MKQIGMEWHVLLPGIAAALLGLLVILLGVRYPPRQLVSKTRVFVGMLKERRAGTWWQKKEDWLRRNGATFQLGKKITPGNLLLSKLLLCLAGVLCGWLQSPVLGCVLGVGLFFVPELLVWYLNRRDNERMLPELRLVYHGLSMQIRAGVFVTDALAEMYSAVKEPRFQAALLDLAGDIVMKADLFQALQDFQGKFDNRYVDSLCITVLQAMESGKAVELLGDIAEQVKDMESVVLQKRKGRLDRSLTFYQLGLLSAVLGVALYACVSYMMSAVTLF